MSLSEQVSAGLMVCPVTHTRLVLRGDRLVSEMGTAYRVEGSVPILVQNIDEAGDYVAAGEQMLAEYGSVDTEGTSPQTQSSFTCELLRVLRRDGDDFRTTRSRQAFAEVFDHVEPGALCISIGGGPKRNHPCLVNLNIGPFPNVDVVADAHRLPYADGSIDAIFCEAVLEHLADPHEAVKEMFRVCRPGGLVYANTPFLQAYHGYPNHFQNFTLTGHERLFTAVGFQIRESGTAVGPVFALLDLIERFLSEYSPRRMRKALRALWLLARYFILPMDRWVNARRNAFVLASTTFVVAARP